MRVSHGSEAPFFFLFVCCCFLFLFFLFFFVFFWNWEAPSAQPRQSRGVAVLHNVPMYTPKQGYCFTQMLPGSKCWVSLGCKDSG